MGNYVKILNKKIENVEVAALDKYEYRVRAEEIRSLIDKKEYVEAVKIADTIDWNRVKSVQMLCTISDLYKISRRYEESRDILLLAYERHPTGRMIVYSLCELAIKMEDILHAIEYYKEFVQIAPKDTSRYILQYIIYEAQDVGLEERIAVLEEYKRRDYREKWAYELAYLYHRIGLTTRCVEECDELILWFGEGKYVTKAMELKMLHHPLTPIQEQKYKKKQRISHIDAENVDIEENVYQEFEDEALADSIPEENFPEEEHDNIKVKTVDLSQYNTINLQRELAESMKEILGDEVTVTTEEMPTEDMIKNAIVAPLLQNTVELTLPETLVEEEVYPIPEEMQESEIYEPEAYESETYEIETDELESSQLKGAEDAFPKQKAMIQPIDQQDATEIKLGKPTAIKETSTQAPDNIKPFEDILSQEYDGQISLVVPDATLIEKQITGQMSIHEVLAEWEKTKTENQQKRMEDVKKRVLEHTGSLFAEFDESVKQELLADMEEMAKEANRVSDEKGRLEETKSEVEEVDSNTKDDTDNNIIAEIISEDKALLTEEDTLEAEEAVQEADNEIPGIQQEKVTFNTEALSHISEQLIEALAETEAKNKPEEEKQSKNTRVLSEEEKELFESFMNTKGIEEQIMNAIDTISLASYTGNVIITGEPGAGGTNLAKNLIKEVQMTDDNFSGKVAKITGRVFDKKDIFAALDMLANGALIVEKANGLSVKGLQQLTKALERSNKGIIVIMEDTKTEIDKLLHKHAAIENNFNARIDLGELENDALVSYGKEYAKDREYTIDEMGVLALYTRIADMQTSDHTVTVEDVKEIMDDAMRRADKKNISHFMDILFAKRYDEDDMIILRENDFLDY